MGGGPAKVGKTRFDIDTILLHEAILYAEEKRLSRSYLESKLGELDGYLL